MHSSLHSCTFGQKAPRRSLASLEVRGAAKPPTQVRKILMNQADGKLKNCGPVAHRLGESIASQIIAILYARDCPRGILALLPAAGGPVAQSGGRGRGQRTEDRGQRTEDRGQRTEDRGQRTEGRISSRSMTTCAFAMQKPKTFVAALKRRSPRASVRTSCWPDPARKG
jgi:hypothetical protein